MNAVRYRHRVRSYEVDHQGFVFNGRYLEITDAAMAEYFRGLGFAYPELIDAGFDPAVVSIELRFERPARLDDQLVIDARCAHVGRSSFVLVFTFTRDEQALAEVRTTYVNVAAASETSVPIPRDIRDRLVDSSMKESS